MKEQWLMPGAVVPVDAETTAALVFEIKRLIGIVGGMALNQKHQWVGLTKEDRYQAIRYLYRDDHSAALAAAHSDDEYEAIESKLKAKNSL